jgi:hypothetical protein
MTSSYIGHGIHAGAWLSQQGQWRVERDTSFWHGLPLETTPDKYSSEFSASEFKARIPQTWYTRRNLTRPSQIRKATRICKLAELVTIAQSTLFCNYPNFEVVLAIPISYLPRNRATVSKESVDLTCQASMKPPVLHSIISAESYPRFLYLLVGIILLSDNDKDCFSSWGKRMCFAQTSLLRFGGGAPRLKRSWSR